MAPAFVIKIVEPSFLPNSPPTHMSQPTSHNTQTLSPFPPMPEKATKNWGQADKDLLKDLINKQLINITDTSLDYIEQVRAAHFWHRDKRNFGRNFCNYLAAWDLEVEYSGARRRESRDRLRRLFSAFFIIYLCVI